MRTKTGSNTAGDRGPLNAPLVQSIATKHSRSPAQVSKTLPISLSLTISTPLRV
jgi:hypothetical protein